MQNVIVADQLGELVAGPLQTGLDAGNENRAHVVADALLHLPLGFGFAHAVSGRYEFIVLRRNDDGMYTQGTPGSLVVLDRDLRLGIGTQVGHHFAGTADVGQLLEDDVRKNQRSGHHLARLVAGVTEHDALVAGPLLLLGSTHDALVDVGRLLVDGRENAARIAIELILALGVTDPPDDAAGYALHIDIGLGTHLAGDDHQTGGAQRLASDLGIGIVTQKLVENGVGNLIRHLIGVPFGHRLRCKQKTHRIRFFKVRNHSPPTRRTTAAGSGTEKRTRLMYKMGKIGCWK